MAPVEPKTAYQVRLPPSSVLMMSQTLSFSTGFGWVWGRVAAGNIRMLKKGDEVKKAVLVLALTSACATFSNQVIAATQTYSLIDMGLLPGYGASYGADISDTGVVALSFSPPHGGLTQAATYGIDGKLSGVGRPAGWFYSIGLGVNNSGHMAMEVVPTDGVYTTGQDAVKMTPAGPQLLGPGAGRAINDAGQVTGFAPAPSRDYWGSQATVWSNGVAKGLGFLGNGVRSSGADINSAGHVVGEADTLYHGQAHAFFHDGQEMHDLGVLAGGTWSWAAGINEHDQVIGCSTSAASPNNCHAVIWSGGSIHDLGVLAGGSRSEGHEINDAGDVVGSADTADGQQVAMLYKDGVMHNLNDLLEPGLGSSWQLYAASAINNNGWIVGTARFNGLNRAFLLKPMAAVPEPSAGLLVLAGSFAFAMLRRQRLSATRPRG